MLAGLELADSAAIALRSMFPVSLLGDGGDARDLLAAESTAPPGPSPSRGQGGEEVEARNRSSDRCSRASLVASIPLQASATSRRGSLTCRKVAENASREDLNCSRLSARAHRGRADRLRCEIIRDNATRHDRRTHESRLAERAATSGARDLAFTRSTATWRWSRWRALAMMMDLLVGHGHRPADNMRAPDETRPSG